MFAVACKKDQSATGADAKQAMGLYAQGFNALLDDPKRLIAGYFSTIEVGEKGGIDLSRSPRLSDAGFAQRKVKEAKEAFAQAKEAAPASLGIGPKADAAVAAAEQALATYETAFKYYQAESYKDDKGAQAAKLHEQMIAARKAFDGAMAAMGDAMDAIEDAQANDEITKYEGDKSYRYWFRFYTQQAKRFVTTLTKTSEPAKLREAAKALAVHDAALGAFVAAKGGKLNDTFKTYAEYATSFQAEVTKLMRLVDAGKTFEDRETGEAADAVIGAYNRLVSMNNTLYQVEAVGKLEDL
ncbi:MAG TPA: DUF3829 domain-containing protein [Kofleriaceae bacterium]|nr:DUF3829 domain-containing protein [Kofleriaceae bacterium]